MKKLKCPNCKKMNYRKRTIRKNTETICHYCKTKFNAYDSFVKDEKGVENVSSNN